MSDLISKEVVLRFLRCWLYCSDVEELVRVYAEPVQAQIDREHVAFSMWKAEADRAAPNVGKNRTPEGFANAAEQERDRWLMLADAAIEAIRKEDQP